jgi:hypothetical protein
MILLLIKKYYTRILQENIPNVEQRLAQAQHLRLEIAYRVQARAYEHYLQNRQ